MKSNVKYPDVSNPSNNKGVYEHTGDPVNPKIKGGGTSDPKEMVKGMNIPANQKQNAAKMGTATIGKKFRNKFGG